MPMQESGLHPACVGEHCRSCSCAAAQMLHMATHPCASCHKCQLMLFKMSLQAYGPVRSFWTGERSLTGVHKAARMHSCLHTCAQTKPPATPAARVYVVEVFPSCYEYMESTPRHFWQAGSTADAIRGRGL